METYPDVKDVVLIGGGHTHALVLRKWGMRPLPGARLTLIDPSPNAAYSGMLPGFVAGHYTREELDIDLVKLAQFAGARLITGRVSGVDHKRRLIKVPGRTDVAFDICSVDIGITSDMPDLPGFNDHAVPAKPLGPFASRWDAYRKETVDPKVAVLGAGVAGAELALAMAHALKDKGPKIHLIDRSEALSALGPRARGKMIQALAEAGVEMHERTEVRSLSSDGVVLIDGETISADFITGAAGARPYEWVGEIGLKLQDGFIEVDETLQASVQGIFATGDCAHMEKSPRPKAGVFAVRQAPVLFHNLRAALRDRPLKAYRPQRDYLKLISLGKRAALAEKAGVTLSGPLLWVWKDRIDRAFMQKLSDLPKMSVPEAPTVHAKGLRDEMGSAPMCGGCGSKVGSATLSAVLEGLPSGPRADVARLPGDDAGLIQMGQFRQVMSTDHLRALTKDPVLMTEIAAVHALGDIWAMGAAPQAATVSLILPKMSEVLQRRTLDEIMAAAQQVMTRAGANIVGGHTSVGSEMTVGFTVTGLCEREPITLSGGKAGDTLILTKPIGSGVVMAAHMQGRANGADVVQTFDLMRRDQARASELLSDAHAMTDVTGFGLAGHLQGICAASGTGARLVLDAIEWMPGARTLADKGVRSTIYPANRSAVDFAGEGPEVDLLLDPQTAGGLLAAVETAHAEMVCNALKGEGYPAAIIGVLTEIPGLVIDQEEI